LVGFFTHINEMHGSRGGGGGEEEEEHRMFLV
jgi:hypothetical protein